MGLHHQPAPQPQLENLLDGSLPAAEPETNLKGEFVPLAHRMVGYMCRPTEAKAGQRFNTLLILGGSEGGVDTERVEFWAQRGYVAMGVAYHQGAAASPYFASMCVPPHLANIELKGFIEALNLLATDRASTGKIGVIGASRGAELALILGALYSDQIAAVVAKAPAGTSNTGYSHDASVAGKYLNKRMPAWLLDGETYTGELDPAYVGDYSFGRIPVEKISAPLFVVSGGKDTVWCQDVQKWPHIYDARQIVQTRSNDRDTVLHYDDGGHYFFEPDSLEKILELMAENPEGAKRYALSGGGDNQAAVLEASRSYFTALEDFLARNHPSGARTGE